VTFGVQFRKNRARKLVVGLLKSLAGRPRFHPYRTKELVPIRNRTIIFSLPFCFVRHSGFVWNLPPNSRGLRSPETSPPYSEDGAVLFPPSGHNSPRSAETFIGRSHFHYPFVFLHIPVLFGRADPWLLLWAAHTSSLLSASLIYCIRSTVHRFLRHGTGSHGQVLSDRRLLDHGRPEKPTDSKALTVATHYRFLRDGTSKKCILLIPRHIPALVVRFLPVPVYCIRSLPSTSSVV
jgi:hypothetical protein